MAGYSSAKPHISVGRPERKPSSCPTNGFTFKALITSAVESWPSPFASIEAKMASSCARRSALGGDGAFGCRLRRMRRGADPQFSPPDGNHTGGRNDRLVGWRML